MSLHSTQHTQMEGPPPARPEPTLGRRLRLDVSMGCMARWEWLATRLPASQPARFLGLEGSYPAPTLAPDAAAAQHP